MNVPQLLAELERDEDFRTKPYDDATGLELKPGDTLQGCITIGIGVNLSEGLTRDEAMTLSAGRVARAERDARRALPCFSELSDARQRALVNMAFNLGLPRLLKFRNMLGAFAAHDYERAATEALDSVWARQVGERAERIATMIREG